MKRIYLFSIIFLLLNCSQTKKMNYTYADGNGNTYRLMDLSLKYNPIQAKDSSSGTYSGGEKKEVVVTQANREKLMLLFQKAIDNKSIHNAKRTMGSGTIYFQKGEEFKKIFLLMRAKEKREIESFLKDLLK